MFCLLCDISMHHCLLFQSEVRVPDFPANESKGSHTVPFTSTIFIEQSDFREVRDKHPNYEYLHSISTSFLQYLDCTQKMMLDTSFAGDGEGLQASDPRTTRRPQACWVCHLCQEGYQGKSRCLLTLSNL